LRVEGPEPVLRSIVIVIVVFSQLYPTRRKKVKADSEEEDGEGDQQQARFSLLFSFNINKMHNYTYTEERCGSSTISLRISDSGFALRQKLNCKIFLSFRSDFFLLNLKN
jgi:hypothetical protein